MVTVITNDGTKYRITEANFVRSGEYEIEIVKDKEDINSLINFNMNYVVCYWIDNQKVIIENDKGQVERCHLKVKNRKGLKDASH